MDEEKICDFRILRELRRSHDLSIADLSAQSGVSASVISKLERNQTKAELDTLYRLARVFRLSLGDLISLAENKAPHQVNEESSRSAASATATCAACTDSQRRAARFPSRNCTATTLRRAGC